MKFIRTYLAGVFEIELDVINDDRGKFSRQFCQTEMKAAGLDKPIVQVNLSINNFAGTIRGMHFQYPPFAEMKFIRCIKGKAYDVAVDARKGSPTFLNWQAVELSSVKNNMICIPEGCAHGFQALEADTELLYMHTSYYHRESEGAFRYDDPLLKINWPLPANKVSEKDKSYSLLTHSFEGINLNALY